MRNDSNIRLNTRTYLAPIPVLLLGRNGQIEDFNLSFQAIAGKGAQKYRHLPFQQLLKEIGARVEGNFLPGISREVASDSSRIVTHSVDDKENAIQVGTCRLHSELFGRIELRSTLIRELDLYTGKLRAISVFFEIVGMEGEERFRETLLEEWNHQLIWVVYAVSYDRVLPRLPFYQEVVQRHIQTMSLPGINKVIDMGAGTGNVAIPLAKAGHLVTAVDISRAMVDKLIAKWSPGRNGSLTIYEQNAESLTHLESESFDGVNILLALFDMATPMDALNEAIRLLRPGGVLVLTEPKRCFDMEKLLTFAEVYLKEKGLYEKLSEDWHRVTHVNRKIDPAKRSPLFVEDIVEWLSDAGIRVRSAEDSHLGNCATITAEKAH